MCGEDWFQFFALGLIGSVVCFYWLWRAYRRYRLIADTPTSKVRSAAQGYLELIGAGHAVEDRPLKSPLSDLQCIWYQIEIAKYVRSGKNSHWKTIRKEISRDFFTLRDETGECFVNPAGAEVHALHERVWYGHSDFPLAGPPAEKKLISINRGRYRYTERFMRVEDPVYALGYFETLRPEGLQKDLSVMVREVISEWKEDYQALLGRFDGDSDGSLDLQEWDRVRAAARNAALAERSELQAAPDVHVLGEPPSGYPFLLSGKSEADSSKRYLLQATLSLVGFFGLGALATMLGTECLIPMLR